MSKITDYVARLKLDTKGAFKAAKALDKRVIMSGAVVQKANKVTKDSVDDLGSKIRRNAAINRRANAAAVNGFKKLDGSVKRINNRLSRTGERLDEIRARARRIRFNKALDGVKSFNKGLKESRFLLLGVASAGALSFKTLVGKGSELQESITAVQATFGKSSDAVLDFGKNATDSVLLSRKAFNDSAVELAPFLKNAGLKDEDLNKVLFSVIQRAADTASVLGKDVGEILTKFKAGLSGEAEPLKALGVFVSANALQQQALAEGITKSVAKMSEQEKVALRLNAIMVQTSDKAGDVAKNFESVAIQTQKQRAQVENLAGDFGQNLQPAMQSILRVTGKVLDKLWGLTEEQQDNLIKTGLLVTAGSALLLGLSFIGTAVTGLTALFGFLSAAAGVVTTAVAAMTAVMLANPIGLVIAAVAALVVGLGALAYHFRDELWGAVQFVWDKMKAFFKFLVDNPITRILGKIGKGVADIFTADAEISAQQQNARQGVEARRRARGGRNIDSTQESFNRFAARSTPLSTQTNANNSRSVEIRNDIKVTAPNPTQAGNDISRIVSADIALGFAT